MSIYKYDSTQDKLIPLAGQGKAEYGASTVRTGTVHFSGTSWQSANIVFNKPMPDANYELAFYCEGEVSGMFTTPFCVENKTANGFTLKIYAQGGSSINITIRYTAFKLYTDTEYNSILEGQRYSTDEVDTGKVWIDGKKIYRKVITGTATITANESRVIANVASLNIKHICSSTEMLDYSGNGEFMNMSNSFGRIAYRSNGEIVWVSSIARTNAKFYIILEYTKT